jgi:flagellar biosynthesis/type III secretory pathway ATPase
MSTAMLNRIKLLKDQVPKVPIVACGKLVRGIGLTLEAVGCQMPVGSQCLIQTMEGEIEAEVVGFAEDITYLMPTEAAQSRTRFGCRYGVTWPSRRWQWSTFGWLRAYQIRKTGAVIQTSYESAIA